MKRRYILAPEAASDLAEIWRYIKTNSSVEMAGRVESVIRDRILLLAKAPGSGHSRKDLTNEAVSM